MTIVENDFKIEEGSSPARYDLYLKKIINKGKKDTSGKSLEREDWILEGYDMSMSTILKTLSHHLTDKKVLNIETKAGLRIVELIFDGDEVVGAKVDMQEPILNCKDIPVIFDQEKMINEKVMIGDQEYALTAVSMGNPHVITYVDSLDFDIETIGKQFEHHQIFPESVNTEFVEVINDHYLKMRVWERGSGETMACGTGACAVMYASYLNGYCKEKATVELLGGKLEIELQEGHIFMTGPATTVFEGKIKI